MKNVARWEVEYTDQFEDWWDGLEQGDQDAITAGVEVLEERGPALGRPLVDTVKQSRHANMKELRVPRGNMRVFFAFDPTRTAILLVGGEKTDQWDEFYDEYVPIADDLYDAHLVEIRKEQRQHE